jgi:hypothetical protein
MSYAKRGRWVVMLGFQRFDPEQFRRQLGECRDVKLVELNRRALPAALRYGASESQNRPLRFTDGISNNGRGVNR